MRLLGDSPFVVAFTSEVLDVYHVNDFMKGRGWRFNGLQYPNALHFAVTRPQTQPGVADRFATDLRAAVAYAQANLGKPANSAAIYGGLPGGLTPEAARFIESAMAALMDAQQAVPSQ